MSSSSSFLCLQLQGINGGGGGDLMMVTPVFEQNMRSLYVILISPAFHAQQYMIQKKDPEIVRRPVGRYLPYTAAISELGQKGLEDIEELPDRNKHQIKGGDSEPSHRDNKTSATDWACGSGIANRVGVAVRRRGDMQFDNKCKQNHVPSSSPLCANVDSIPTPPPWYAVVIGADGLWGAHEWTSMWRAHPGKPNIHVINPDVLEELTFKWKALKAALQDPFNDISSHPSPLIRCPMKAYTRGFKALSRLEQGFAAW
ncbi:hypothetical protein BJY52DRAFT_1229521 [Lactarius psammicola]|nr:hypothetical protein BJY52DRAFT_1229521 [Lactarius psammicola]